MSASAGKVLLTPKGDFSTSATYSILDWVRYNGGVYVAKQTTTGNLPTDTTYWSLMLNAPANLADLTDVNIDTTTLADGQTLVYNATTGKFENSESSGGVGKDLTGQTVEPTQGTTVTAGDNAEIFNDYRERAYTGSTVSAGNVASGGYSHAEGGNTTASGSYCHAEGSNTTASGNGSHAEGGNSTASGNTSHAEGYATKATNSYSHAEGNGSTASGVASHTEGQNTTARGNYSHAEGNYTTASSDYSHAEGANTTASAECSHAEGTGTTASGKYSHAEGSRSTAGATCAHAEGYHTTATNRENESYNEGCHAEGYYTKATNRGSHAEGVYTEAVWEACHVGGRGTSANKISSMHSCDFIHGDLYWGKKLVENDNGDGFVFGFTPNGDANAVYGSSLVTSLTTGMALMIAKQAMYLLLVNTVTYSSGAHRGSAAYMIVGGGKDASAPTAVSLGTSGTPPTVEVETNNVVRVKNPGSTYRTQINLIRLG